MRVGRLAAVVSAALVCVASGGLVSGVWAQSSPKPGARPSMGPMPPISVSPRHFHAGVLDPEELVEGRFVLTNTTDEVQFVSSLETTCKCTTPTISSRTIPPGGSVTVDAAIDVRGHLGQTMKAVNVFIEGYERPLSLPMSGLLTDIVQIDDPKLKSLQGEFLLGARDNRPFKVLAVHNAEASFEPFNATADGSARAWRVRYQVNPREVPYILVVETDHPESRAVLPRMFVGGASSGEIKYIKQRKEIYSGRNMVNLEALGRGESFEFAVPLRRPDHSQRPEVRTEMDGLEAEIVSVVPSGHDDDYATYTMRVTNVSAEPGMILTPLYFKTPEDFETRLWMGGIAEGEESSASEASGS